MSCWGFCPSWNQTTRRHNRRAARWNLAPVLGWRSAKLPMTPEPKGKVHATGRFHSQQPFLLLEDLWLPMCAFLWIFQNKFSILFFSPRIYFKPIFTEIWPMPNLTPPKGGAEKKMLIGSHCFTAKNVIKKKKKNFQGASTLLIRIPHRCQRSLWL